MVFEWTKQCGINTDVISIDNTNFQFLMYAKIDACVSLQIDIYSIVSCLIPDDKPCTKKVSVYKKGYSVQVLDYGKGIQFTHNSFNI